MPVSIITYKNKEILFLDNRGLSGEKLLENMKNGTQEFFKRGKGIIALADFTDANLSNEIVNYLQSDESKKAVQLAARQAVVGIAGIKKMILNIYNKVTGSNTRVFDNLDEAKEFLVK